MHLNTMTWSPVGTYPFVTVQNKSYVFSVDTTLNHLSKLKHIFMAPPLFSKAMPFTSLVAKIQVAHWQLLGVLIRQVIGQMQVNLDLPDVVIVLSMMDQV